MSAGTSASLCCLLFVLLVSADQEITAAPGQNITLTCRAPNNNIKVIEWSRPDLKPGFVLLFRDGRFVPEEQNPSFQNRVDLQDRQMKEGNASLILKNVTKNDEGTYKCRVFMRETRSWELRTITLSVVAPPGPTGGGASEGGGAVGLRVGLPVFGLLLVAAVGFAV